MAQGRLQTACDRRIPLRPQPRLGSLPLLRKMGHSLADSCPSSGARPYTLDRHWRIAILILLDIKPDLFEAPFTLRLRFHCSLSPRCHYPSFWNNGNLGRWLGCNGRGQYLIALCAIAFIAKHSSIRWTTIASGAAVGRIRRVDMVNNSLTWISWNSRLAYRFKLCGSSNFAYGTGSSFALQSGDTHRPILLP